MLPSPLILCYTRRPMVLAEWTAHPARRRPRDVALVLAVVLLTAGAVLGSLQSAHLALLAVVILVVSVAPFLFPTHYVLTETGIEQRRAGRRRSRPWRELRRLQVGRDAAMVTPFARPNVMDRYRGMVVLFDGADRADIVRILEQRVGHAQD